MQIRFVSMLLIAVGFASSAIATPPEPHNVEAAIASADLILVGWLTQRPVDAGGKLHGIIKIDRIVKGESRAGSVDLGQWLYPSQISRYGMFLLRRAGASFDTVSNEDSVLVASRNEYLPQGSDQNSSVRVARELANVFLLPEPLAAGSNSGLLNEPSLVSIGTELDSNGFQIVRYGPPSPADRGDSVYLRAAVALSTIPYQFEVKSLRGVLERSKGGKGSIFALASMISADDLSEVRTHQTYLMGDCPSSNGARGYLGSAILGVGWSDYRVSFLASLLSKSHCKEVRAAALQRLSGFGTLPAQKLLPIGLNDTDPEIRQDAVQRICFNTGICDAANAAELAKPENLPRLRYDFDEWVKRQPK